MKTKSMIYLSAQPAEFYFKWQLEVLLSNFSRLGIQKESIHVLLAYTDLIDERILHFIKEYSEKANFYLYEDTRVHKIYSSSVRPHIIKKHFDFFPELQEQVIFYHDADIIFREKLDLEQLIQADNTWYLSDANSYIGIDLLSDFNHNIIHEMARIVGVDLEIVFDNYFNFGGAQYVIKNASISFWEKHERDCSLIYAFLTESLSSYKKKRNTLSELKQPNIDFDYLQVWCSDMWSMILNALYFKHKLQIHKELEFCWPIDNITQWDSTKILHNAGVTKNEAFSLFFKGYFKDYSPFDINLKFVDRNKCSIKYIDEILLTIKNKRFSAFDTVFLYLVKVDSEERYRNLKISIAYINKYFLTNVFVLEVDDTSKINKSDFDDNVEFVFISDNDEYLHRTKYFNQFAKQTLLKTIAYIDCDCFTDHRAIEKCIEAVSNEYILSLPFETDFTNINEVDNIKLFEKTLDIEALKSSRKDVVIHRSFGGGMIVNAEKYLALGGENEQIIGWGIDDIDRVARVLLNNGMVFRAKGSLYHLDHPRGYLAQQDLLENVTKPILELKS